MNERWKVISLPDKQGRVVVRDTYANGYYRQFMKWRMELYADVGRRCCRDGWFRSFHDREGRISWWPYEQTT